MTDPKWRDCADPEELAAAVAAGVEVQRMRPDETEWVPALATLADYFRGNISLGIRYRLPTSWKWRREPPAPDDLADGHPGSRELIEELLAAVPAERTWKQDRIARQLWELSHKPWKEADWAAITDVLRQVYEDRADGLAAAIAALPESAPPWPGAVLSGLCDEDGVPTWLAQAGQVRGEQVRACTSVPWLPNTSYGEDEWVEVRAPRAVPESETERMRAAKALREAWVPDNGMPWEDMTDEHRKSYLDGVDAVVAVMKDGGR